jgi:hypothetical protein
MKQCSEPKQPIAFEGSGFLKTLGFMQQWFEIWFINIIIKSKFQQPTTNMALGIFILQPNNSIHQAMQANSMNFQTT